MGKKEGKTLMVQSYIHRMESRVHKKINNNNVREER